MAGLFDVSCNGVDKLMLKFELSMFGSILKIMLMLKRNLNINLE